MVGLVLQSSHLAHTFIIGFVLSDQKTDVSGLEFIVVTPCIVCLPLSKVGEHKF